MHVTRQNDIRPVLTYPFSQLNITKIPGTAPTDWRFVRRRVMDPDPLPRPLRRGFGKLRADAGARDRTIPPRADGEQRFGEDKGFAIGSDPLGIRSSEPFGNSLAGLVARIEIMVARTD